MQMTYEVKHLPLKSIVPSSTNPRQSFDEAALDQLALSIKEKGVMQPITVRPHPKKDGHFELVAGWRRWLASQRAEQSAIPSIVRQLTDPEARELQLVENLQRADVPPLEEAQGFQALMRQNPEMYTVEEIAKRIGKDEKFVCHRLKLLDLIEDAQKVVAAQRLPLSHAYELARLEAAHQQAALNVCFDGNTIPAVLKDKYNTVSISVRDLRGWIKQNCLLDLKTAPFDTADATLVPSAGPCSTCPKQAGNNRLLFSDIAKGATCMDGHCFLNKMSASVQRQLDGLKKQGFTPVRITERHYRMSTDDKDLLTRENYKPSMPVGCASTQPAVYVEGKEVGKTIYICANVKCSEHATKSRYSSPEDKKRRTEEIQKQKIEKEYRFALIRAVQTKLPKRALHDDLLFLARSVFQLIGNDTRRRAFRAYQWEETKSAAEYGGHWVDYETLTSKKLAQMGSDELIQFLLMCLLSRDLAIPGYNPNETLDPKAELVQAAKRHGVDPKVVRQKVTALLTKSKEKNK